MKLNNIDTISVFTLALLASPSGMAADVYKYQLPDQSISYRDDLSNKGKLIEIIPMPPPDPMQAEESRQVLLRRQDAKQKPPDLQRERNLSAVEEEIHDATLGLDAAKQNLHLGLEPQPGDRLGSAIGLHTRLTASYWRRVRELQSDVEDAKDRLDTAYSARNAIQ